MSTQDQVDDVLTRPLLKKMSTPDEEMTYNSDSALMHKGNSVNYNSLELGHGPDTLGHLPEVVDSDPSSSEQDQPDAHPQITQRRLARYRESSNKVSRKKNANGMGLNTRKQVRKTIKQFVKQSTSKRSAPMRRVSGFCLADSLNVFPLLSWLMHEKQGVEEAVSDFAMLSSMTKSPRMKACDFGSGWSYTMYLGAIHAIYPSATRTESGEFDRLQQRDIFYFATGCVVFWNVTRGEEQRILSAIASFTHNPVEHIEFEELEYCYGTAWRIVNDEVTLVTNNPMEKLALSFSLGTSCKLDVFEQQVEDTIKTTRHIPIALAATGKIAYSHGEISRLIGTLFIVRSDVNLNSDMLDEPDFFWDNDIWEPHYVKMLGYLDVTRRITVLNNRMDIIRELLEVLNQQLEHHHASHLEWIIIWLIVAEVVVEVVWNMFIKDILGFFQHNTCLMG